MTFEELPIVVQAEASRRLREAAASVLACMPKGVVSGYWIESHSLGCRKLDGASDLWAAHGDVWNQLLADETAILIGDPADGAFVSITPIASRGATMGAEMLIELGRRVKKTVPLKKGDRIAKEMLKFLEPYAQTAMIAGSVRRRRPQIGDVELVVLPKDLDEFLDFLDQKGWEGGDRIRKKMVANVPVELYIAHKTQELGSMLMWYTGDWVFNVAMNSIAKRMGYTRNQYGIWKGQDLVFQNPDEREFFDFLGVDWHEPEDRSFKDRPKGKKSTMGAEMLIELGAIERKVGYIELKLISPEEDGTDNWVLRVDRIDPYGGDTWQGEFPFPNEDDAKSWFKMIQGDEDIEHLISIFSRQR